MAEAAAGARLDAAFNVRGDVTLAGSSDGTYTITINPSRMVRKLYRSLFRMNRKVQNTIWPFTPGLWALGCSGVIARVVTAPAGSWWRSGFLAEFLWRIDSAFPWQRRLPTNLRVAWLSFAASAVGLLGISFLQRSTMRLLLNYHGHMFLPRGKTPWYIKLWSGALMVLGGSKPSLYNFQGCLPTVPVPPLKQTCEKFLRSVKPLLEDDKYKEMEEKCKEFIAKDGWKCQLYLKFRALYKRSWLWDWWETYVYLKGEDPIMINSNYYIMDGYQWTPTKHQAARTASLVFEADGFKKLIDYEQLEPVRQGKIIPWCMKQYERLFDTTRVPGRSGDTIEHYEVDLERYIAVSRKGVWYKLPLLVKDKRGHRSITLPELEKQFERIIQDADARPAPPTENAIAALTGWRRNWWAEVREREFDRGINDISLQLVERAAFHVHLADKKPADLVDQARMLMHGDGKSLWFDKSVTIITFPDGKGGCMCEHSYADALTNAHMWEWLMSGEAMHGHLTGPDTHTKGYDAVAVDQLRAPERLSWRITPELAEKIEEAVKHNQEQIDNLDHTILQFEDWGKGFVKKAKCSPDAFAQLAMQLAYRMDTGRKALVYEASVTRFFSHGRTETVRSLTIESKAFVDAMMDEKASNAERVKKLKAAADVHSDLYKNAMVGQGVDRHLFGLYLVMRGFRWAKEDDFISQAIRIPWTLSTSQSPQNQTSGRWDPNGKDAKMISPGGGFGPVDKDGYGVSYMFPNDNVIFAHISSKRNSAQTDSKRFKDNIAKALNMIRKAIEEEAASKEKSKAN